MKEGHRMNDDLTMTRGSGNVFADLGLPNAEEELIKARLVATLSELIEIQGLSQTAAGSRMGLSQPDVSKLLRGRIGGYSLERLLGFVRALGSDVEIKIKRRGGSRASADGIGDTPPQEGRMVLLVA
jgi:predicted XRE-type DNA-binding protein